MPSLRLYASHKYSTRSHRGYHSEQREDFFIFSLTMPCVCVRIYLFCPEIIRSEQTIERRNSDQWSKNELSVSYVNMAEWLSSLHQNGLCVFVLSGAGHKTLMASKWCVQAISYPLDISYVYRTNSGVGPLTHSLAIDAHPWCPGVLCFCIH